MELRSPRPRRAISTADSKVEFASALGISALNIGRFTQYVLFQYDDPSPGLLLTGSITSRSSIMPQKRNPSAVERLRLAATEAVSVAEPLPDPGGIPQCGIVPLRA